jgi:hypothetical protein
MSVPHTGKLEARIKGHLCQFNGNVWTTPDPELTALLNAARHGSPVTHYSIDELARCILHKADLEPVSEILWFKGDSWTPELPPGAID